MVKKILVATAIFAGLALSTSYGNAAPICACYPPPGGVNFSGSGAAGLTGGRTNTYDFLDHSAFDVLWWGPAAVGSAMDGGINEVGETMSFSSAVGQVAYWTGTTDVTTSSGVQPIYTRLTATILGGATGWLTPVSVGITPGPLQVTEVTGDPFIVNFIFEASLSLNGTYTAIRALFDSLPKPNNNPAMVVTNLDGQFFYAEPPLEVGAVPIPAALPLFAAALGVLGFLSRRRRRKAALAA